MQLERIRLFLSYSVAIRNDILCCRLLLAIVEFRYDWAHHVNQQLDHCDQFHKVSDIIELFKLSVQSLQKSEALELQPADFLHERIIEIGDSALSNFTTEIVDVVR